MWFHLFHKLQTNFSKISFFLFVHAGFSQSKSWVVKNTGDPIRMQKKTRKKQENLRNTYHQCIKVTTISSNNQATNENNQHIFGAFNKIKFADFLF